MNFNPRGPRFLGLEWLVKEQNSYAIDGNGKGFGYYFQSSVAEQISTASIYMPSIAGVGPLVLDCYPAYPTTNGALSSTYYYPSLAPTSPGPPGDEYGMNVTWANAFGGGTIPSGSPPVYSNLGAGTINDPVGAPNDGAAIGLTDYVPTYFHLRTRMDIAAGRLNGQRIKNVRLAIRALNRANPAATQVPCNFAVGIYNGPGGAVPTATTLDEKQVGTLSPGQSATFYYDWPLNPFTNAPWRQAEVAAFSSAGGGFFTCHWAGNSQGFGGQPIISQANMYVTTFPEERNGTGIYQVTSTGGVAGIPQGGPGVANFAMFQVGTVGGQTFAPWLKPTGPETVILRRAGSGVSGSVTTLDAGVAAPGTFGTVHYTLDGVGGHVIAADSKLFPGTNYLVPTHTEYAQLAFLNASGGFSPDTQPYGSLYARACNDTTGQSAIQQLPGNSAPYGSVRVVTSWLYGTQPTEDLIVTVRPSGSGTTLGQGRCAIDGVYSAQLAGGKPTVVAIILDAPGPAVLNGGTQYVMEFTGAGWLVYGLDDMSAGGATGISTTNYGNATNNELYGGVAHQEKDLLAYLGQSPTTPTLTATVV